MDTLFSFKYMRVIVATIGVLLIVLVGAQITESLNIFSFEENYATINVEGVAKVTAIPDIGSFNFTVEAESLAVGDAQKKSGEKINVIMSYLKNKGGVEEKDLKTTNYNTYPRYEYKQTECIIGNCNQKRVLKGYVVTQNVRVKVRDTARAGDLVAGVGSRGATNISGLVFSVDNMEDKKEKARLLAIRDAKEKAKHLVKELGVKLGDILNFNDGRGGSITPILYNERALSALSAEGEMADKTLAPEIAVGEDTVMARVTITYKIK